LNNFQIFFPAAVQTTLNAGDLTFALAPGLYSQTQRFNELRFVDPSDPFNVGSSQTQTLLNLNAGLHFQFNGGLYLGLAGNNLLSPSFNFGLDSLENKVAPTLNLIAGKEYTTFGSDFTFLPTVMLRSDLNTFTFETVLITKFKDKAFGGLSYRYQESINFILGYSVLPDNKLVIGYSLDYVIDQRNAKQPTSQEIYFRYNLPDLVIGGRKEVKTPRFTY
jgi:type IX secretion system PorP/SprF family membrane protein